jgi:hypothetical protein
LNEPPTIFPLLLKRVNPCRIPVRHFFS